MAKGLLINVTAENVIRLLPPLVLSEEEAELAVESMAKLIKVYAGDDRGRQRRAESRNGSDRRKLTS
jgi:acetylornithine aminotransferase